jgi:hypothetical protein
MQGKGKGKGRETHIKIKYETREGGFGVCLGLKEVCTIASKRSE